MSRGLIGRAAAGVGGNRDLAAAAALAACCVGVLLIACRTAPLGVPVSDDYLILAHQRFGAFRWMDSHGLAWYWRPVSRQLYYGLLGPWLTTTPAVAVGVHLLLLLVTFGGMWAFARRFLPGRGALLAAAFPLLVEPARTLLGWPSAAQHLIAMAGVAAAVAAASYGRLVLALVAGATAMLSIETAALVLPVLPLVASRAAPGVRRRWTVACAATGGGWLALRLLAAARGVEVPGMAGAATLGTLPPVLARSAAAQLGLEDMPLALLIVAAAAYAAIVWAAWRPPNTRDGTPAGPEPLAAGASHVRWLLLGGLLWWLAGTAPLAGVPDWNAWRSSLPGLGLGVALAAVVSTGPRWCVPAALALRASLLLLATPASPFVQVEPPPASSQLSFVRLARLQHTLIATRAVLSAPPSLTRGARVRYWNFPQLTEVGFGGSSALRLWFDDPTMVWAPFGESVGFKDTAAVVLAYDEKLLSGAVRIRREVQRDLLAANAAVIAGHLSEADGWLEKALKAQPEPVGRLCAVVLGNRASLQLELGALARADSLHRLGAGVVPLPEWQRTEIALALALRDTSRAREGVREALARSPDDRRLHAVQRLLAGD